MTDRVSRPLPRVAWAALAAAASTLAAARPGRAQELPPTPGEQIRFEVGAPLARELGMQTPWEGTFIMVRENDLVASNTYNGGVALPLSAVQELRVRRPRPRSFAIVRGAVVGGAFGIAAWPFLRFLCRGSCNNGLGSAWLPATASGLLVGVLVGGQGPGTHWVAAPVPRPEPAPTGVALSLSVPRLGR